MLSGTDISCSGNIETLLDWETVRAGGHPEAATRCFRWMFRNNACLISAPDLTLPEVPSQAYIQMFQNSGITQPPRITATILGNACCVAMCSGTPIRLSETQTGAYTTPYRIPAAGTGTAVSYAMAAMFTDTAGTFTGTPVINTTYYLAAD